jgi:protein-disulfide isomerase
VAGAALAATVPHLDKEKFAEYVKYAEGLTDQVTLTVEDPTPTAAPEFFSVMVHMRASSGPGKESYRVDDKRYYVTADGQHVLDGAMWRLGESPFEGTLRLLPETGLTRGSASARVQIEVFSDFQCPYCRQLATTLRDDVTKTYSMDVRITFADFPLETKHPWARAAAEAGHCIGDGKPDAFWTFHDWMFQHQDDIDPNGKNLKDKVLAFVQENKWDTNGIGACMDSHAKAQEVSSNEERAALLGVHQTPTMFVDGRKVEGAVPWSSLQNLIKYELNRPKDIGLTEK